MLITGGAKETVIQDLGGLQDRISNYSVKDIPNPLSKRVLYEYDEIISTIDIVFNTYPIDDKTLRESFDEIPLRPKDRFKLIDAYNLIRRIIDGIIEQLRSNLNFSINSEGEANRIAISRTYLYSIKEKANQAEKLRKELLDFNEQLNSETNARINAEKVSAQLNAINASLEESLNQMKQTNGMLQTTTEAYSMEKDALKRDLGNVTNQYDEAKMHIAEANEALSVERSELESVKDNNKLLNAEIKTLNIDLGQYKAKAQKFQVARNSTDFENQANGNKTIAYRWMYAIIGSIFFFSLFLWHIFSSDSELFSVATGIIAKSTATLGKISESKKSIEAIDPVLLKQLILVEIAKKIGSKILIISLLTYVVTFLVKNYNAQMHNYIVNSHKANALRSTVDLIGTARGDEGNDKIVLQATQAIFTTQKSGYQGAESEPTSPNLITNVIDAVSGSKKS